MGKKNIEVEIKARTDDIDEVETKLRNMGSLLDEIDYKDTYFKPAGVDGYTSYRFRLRRSKETALVTAKEKIEQEGCDASREHEFEVSDPEAFENFVLLFGFKVMIEKSKKGRRWQLELAPGKSAVVELVSIEGLGKFVEIEIMVDDTSQVTAAADGIRELLNKLGIPESAIEERPYTFLLYELGYGEGSS